MYSCTTVYGGTQSVGNGWDRANHPRIDQGLTDNGRFVNNAPMYQTSEQVHHGPVTHGGCTAGGNNPRFGLSLTKLARMIENRYRTNGEVPVYGGRSCRWYQLCTAGLSLVQTVYNGVRQVCLWSVYGGVRSVYGACSVVYGRCT